MFNKRLAAELKDTVFLGFPVFSVVFSLLATLPPIPDVAALEKLPVVSVLWASSPVISWGLAAFLLVLWLINAAIFLNVFFHEDRLRPKAHPRAATVSLAGLCLLLLILEVSGPSLRSAISLLSVYAVFGWLIAVIITGVMP